MNERYILSRGELLELLEAQYRLAALERGGVDNWNWYSEALGDFLMEYKTENKHLLSAGMDKEKVKEYFDDFDFADVAEFELGCYETEGS